MIRLALPKGRNLGPVLHSLRAAGIGLSGFDPERLRQRLDDDSLEILLLKDWDLPLYVEQGIADCGFVGSDVLEELGSDLLRPLRLLGGRCRMSLIGRDRTLPAAGEQIRIATKYPRWAARLLAGRPWGIEIVRLSGSVELGPLLHLAELAIDIVQSGRTIRDHRLFEIEVLAEIAPSLVLNRAAFQRRRRELNEIMERLEGAEVTKA
jgi:ATP phosphoribosyltransferase